MTELYMLTEHSLFMMSFVYITDENNAIVIDGGRPSDMPYLLEVVGDRKIAAWILTHPHYDHIWGFNHLVKETNILDRIGKIYYNFPSVDFVLKCEPEFCTEEEPCSVKDFNDLLPKMGNKAVFVKPYTSVEIDNLKFEFLYAGGEKHYLPKPNLAVNESSLAFKVTGKNLKSVMFLGDLGPEGGRELLRLQGEKLRSDIVQVSHHGHSGVTEEVYRAIAPSACMWCCADWLYNEPDVEFEPELWGTMHQRKIMDKLNVAVHYVTKDGTQKIDLGE